MQNHVVLALTQLPVYIFRVVFLVLLNSILGCVSVELPGAKAIHAEKVNFSEPQSPFKALKSESADRAWQSEHTHNTIAYQSDCNSALDNSLTSMADDTLSALSDAQVLEKKDSISFNDREALEIVAGGKIDGVKAEIWVLVFKKNGCNFTLTYMGSRKHFEAEKQTFINFRDSFKVSTW